MNVPVFVVAGPDGTYDASAYGGLALLLSKPGLATAHIRKPGSDLVFPDTICGARAREPLNVIGERRILVCPKCRKDYP